MAIWRTPHRAVSRAIGEHGNSEDKFGGHGNAVSLLINHCRETALPCPDSGDEVKN